LVNGALRFENMSLPKLPPRLTGRSKLTDWLNQLREFASRSMPQPGTGSQSVTTRGVVRRDKGGAGGSGGDSKPPRWA
jgi:hypothetical protein